MYQVSFLSEEHKGAHITSPLLFDLVLKNGGPCISKHSLSRSVIVQVSIVILASGVTMAVHL
jgi:hypothetical protein